MKKPLTHDPLIPNNPCVTSYLLHRNNLKRKLAASKVTSTFINKTNLKKSFWKIRVAALKKLVSLYNPTLL
jgi:hypothetical protein